MPSLFIAINYNLNNNVINIYCNQLIIIKQYLYKFKYVLLCKYDENNISF